jgi:4-amino-4-deoxy-L-arabinose transferase-like glycosyltransferase
MIVDRLPGTHIPTAMSGRWNVWATVLVLGAVLAIYTVRLQDAPVYLSPDEATIAVDAHALAATGADVYGRVFPLYFQTQVPGESRMGWFTPAIFYFSALFLKVLPFSEWSVRLPTACIGIADVLLVWLIGRRVFRDERLALTAAVLLASTPAHFILSRYALDYLYPLPFVLGWLLLLVMYLESGKAIELFAATACLGVGFYSYIASVAMMPLFFVLTCLVLYQAAAGARAYRAAALGFLPPLIPVAVWLARHPGAFAETVQRYDLYDASRLNPLQGLREFLSFPNIDRLVSLYWTFLNPSFLFLTGDRAMMFSTRTIGVFLLPIAALLSCGLIRIASRPVPGQVEATARPVRTLIALGFFSAPVAALLGSEGAAIGRAVAMLPFAVLLATFGIEQLWSLQQPVRFRRPLMAFASAALVAGAAYALFRLSAHARPGRGAIALIIVGAAAGAVALVSDRLKAGRAALAFLLLLVPIQFGAFLVDYFTDYRLRSQYWLGGNLRGALEQLIDRQQQEQAPRVYLAKFRSTSGLLDTRNRWIDVYWKFYLIKHGRTDLLDRTAFIDPQYRQEVLAMPRGSLVLGNLEDTTTAALVKERQLAVVAAIPELEGQPFFSILRR